MFCAKVAEKLLLQNAAGTTIAIPAAISIFAALKYLSAGSRANISRAPKMCQPPSLLQNSKAILRHTHPLIPHESLDDIQHAA